MYIRIFPHICYYESSIFSYGWLWNSPQLLTLFNQENFTVGTVFNLFALCATNHIKSKFGTSWQEAIAEFMGTPWFCSVLPRRRKRLSTTLSPHFFIDTCKRYLYLKLLRQIIFQGNRYENPCTWLKGASWVCHCRLLLQWNISISNKIA